MEAKKKIEPIVETDAEARKRAADLPEQPTDHVVRGYGAQNPIEGPLDEEDRKE